MSKQIVYTAKAPKPSGAYSQAVRLGDTLYVAGTCPFDLETGAVLAAGDVRRQTQIVLQYIGEILQAAGTSLDNVVKVTAFLDELNNFAVYNEAYAAFFPHDPPARSTVEIVKFPPGMTVEIECVAWIPQED